MSDIPARMGIPEHEFRLIFGRTKIDYDLGKEEINRKKHGYSLESATWLLERVLFPVGGAAPYVPGPGSMKDGEVRHTHLTVDEGGKVVLIVTTMRPNETVRVISCRRASESERVEFLSMTGYGESEPDGSG